MVVIGSVITDQFFRSVIWSVIWLFLVVGAFKRKSVEEARDLIEDLAKCNMNAPSEFSRGNNRGKGVMELSKMTAMEAKLDTIMHRMDKQERKMHTAHEIGVVERE